MAIPIKQENKVATYNNVETNLANSDHGLKLSLLCWLFVNEHIIFLRSLQHRE